MRKPVLLFAIAACLAFGPAASSDGHVSIWDSSVLPDLTNGILPIGGSGQIPGHFQVKVGKTGTGEVQVGIRIQERFVGLVEPRGHKYFATTGASDDDGRATWNFDLHLDFGSQLSQVIDGESTEPIGPTDHTFDDFEVFLVADCDPAKNTRPVEISLNDLGFEGFGIKLLQQSWNMGFGFLEALVCAPQGLSDFPFDDEGEYEFGLVVREARARGAGNRSPGRIVAHRRMTVVVRDS